MARAAWELGRRMVDVGLLRRHDDVRHLRLDELVAVVRRRVPFVHTAAEPAGRSLPARFRLDDDGRPWAVARRQPWPAADAIGAGGGTATAAVHVHSRDGEVPPGSVLVVSHLDPRLAPVIPRLAGLVAETGSPLSHLAILAREHGVATVVGFADATSRLQPGEVVTVDGHGGTVTSGVAA